MSRTVEIVWDKFERNILCSRCCSLFNSENGCMLGYDKRVDYFNGDRVAVFDAGPDEECPGEGFYELNEATLTKAAKERD